jgi:regulator of protease activity HflC (stomatin/prohibitin superfamily)
MAAEFHTKPRSGWSMLAIQLLAIVAIVAGVTWTIYSTVHAPYAERTSYIWQYVAWFLALALHVMLWCGFFTLQPNTAGVLLLFGEYKGTAVTPGFHWVNPFFNVIKVSLRARNLNGERLKVNDQRGNPIEIAAVVVWRVHDTAKATFDVDDYVHYVSIQSESAVRHLASSYPYDANDENVLSLRGSTDEVSKSLQAELQERLDKAGVVVDEARLSHLAYAPEIAGAMLRRQQAEAVVAARTRIVEGAVGMVQMALEHLEKDKVVEMDGERKAAMVSNLLVVLCGEQNAQPVVNTGTLYT